MPAALSFQRGAVMFLSGAIISKRLGQSKSRCVVCAFVGVRALCLCSALLRACARPACVRVPCGVQPPSQKDCDEWRLAHS